MIKLYNILGVYGIDIASSYNTWKLGSQEDHDDLWFSSIYLDSL